jgi:predicted NUDIX family NTP pyrophosphohydrolase
MKTSCGVLIINEFNEIFVGHSTGNKFFDIPKGLLDEGETPINCAIRECQEESSIVLHKESLIDLGLFKYNKEKNLHLFLTSVKKESIDLKSLVCTSMFEHVYTKKMLPEADYFKWMKFEDVTIDCAKSMGKLLSSLIETNTIKYSFENHQLQKLKL